MYYIYVPVLLRYMQLVPRNEKVKACKTKITVDMKKQQRNDIKHAFYALFYRKLLYLKVGHDGG